MNRKEKSVRSFVQWLRDTPHYRAGYNDDFTKFTVTGRPICKTIAVATFTAAKPYFEPAKNSNTHMFWPSDLGMRLINDEIEFRDMDFEDQAVLELVQWVRSTPHMKEGLRPQDQDEHVLFETASTRRLRVSRTTWLKAKPFIELAASDNKRLYRPSQLGYKLLTGEVGPSDGGIE